MNPAILAATAVRARRRRREGGAGGPPFTVAGLTAYWDTTGQTGAESSIPDVVGGLNAAHSATKPAWNAARRLWTYPGVHTVQSNTAALAALGTSGVWTVELVYALNATTPNFGQVAGMTSAGVSGDFILQHSSTTRQGLFENNTPGQTTLSGGAATLGTLYHVFAISDGANFSLYVNNTLVAGPTAGVGRTQASAQVGFGDRPAATAPAACDAGWMRYYAGKALDSAERAANYAHARSLFPELP